MSARTVPASGRFSRLARRAPLLVGGLLVGLVVLTALVSLLWTPHDPGAIDPAHRLQHPGAGHLLGTDTFGRDIASRLMAGSRIALLVGVVSVAIAAVLGIPLGIVAGMGRGRWSRLVLRATDLLYAFPAILIAMLLAAALGGSTWTGMAAIGIATVPAFTRVARAGTLTVMSEDHILAARASGFGWGYIARRHVWPNIMALMGVQASAAFGLAILSEAALSYLGLATQPTTPTWGRMAYDAQMQLFNDPLEITWPSLAIVLAVLGFNLLGDGLRDLLDPRLREAA